MDIRVEKTKRSIHNAFLELRSKKELEKISIKELCERAMINKSTFYSHYEDIYALSEMLEQQVVDSVIESLAHPADVFTNPERFTVELFEAYLSQDSLIRILFSGNRSGQLIRKIERSLEELIFAANPSYREDPGKNIILSYCIYGGFYAFAKNRHYGEAKVVSLLGRITSETVKLML